MQPTTATASYRLLAHCRPSVLDNIQASTTDTRAWVKTLSDCLASLHGSDLDAVDSSGQTALCMLASYRPPPALDAVLGSAIQMLTAAGANPLAGSTPAILLVNPFIDSPGHDAMLQALVAAQRAGTPLRPTEGSGNLLHAMLNRNIGTLMHLARDQMSALSDAGDVLAAWRDEQDDNGRTPVDLAWEQYPARPGPSAEGAAAALWSLLLPGSKGIWQPPPLDMVCADGEPLYRRVMRKINDGMDVPAKAKDLALHIQALAAQEGMQGHTAQPNAGPSSSPRF